MPADFTRLAREPLVDVGRPTPARARFGAVIREIVERRELVGLLVRRELKARYKDSSLGFVWALMRPLALFAVYFVAIGQFLGAARAIPDFAIFVFAGLTLWTLYSEIITAATTSILGNAALIKKVYLPREIFPIAAAGSAFINFLIQFAVLIAAVLIAGRFPLSWNLLYVPVAIMLALVWALALGTLFAALNVYLRDVQHLVEVATMLLFWASPIVYSWAFVVDAAGKLSMPWVEGLFLANPITVAVLAIQKGIWSAGADQPWPHHLDLIIVGMMLAGAVALFAAQRVFHRLQGNFAQEL